MYNFKEVHCTCNSLIKKERIAANKEFTLQILIYRYSGKVERKS